MFPFSALMHIVVPPLLLPRVALLLLVIANMPVMNIMPGVLLVSLFLFKVVALLEVALLAVMVMVVVALAVAPFTVTSLKRNQFASVPFHTSLPIPAPTVKSALRAAIDPSSDDVR